MKTTCGIFVLSNNKLLIVHPTGHKNNSWSIPKGIFDEDIDKTYLDAAIREVYEETNLKLDLNNGLFIDLGKKKYKNGKKELQAFLFKSDINLTICDLKCNSYFDFNNKNLPEVDKFMWIDLNSKYVNFLHETQRTLISKIIK